MKRITILAAAGALLAFPAIGTTAAFAATDDGAAHVRVHAKHGADDPAGHHRHHRADDKFAAGKPAPTTPRPPPPPPPAPPRPLRGGTPPSPYDARPRSWGRARRRAAHAMR